MALRAKNMEEKFHYAIFMCHWRIEGIDILLAGYNEPAKKMIRIPNYS